MGIVLPEMFQDAAQFIGQIIADPADSFVHGRNDAVMGNLQIIQHARKLRRRF